MDEVRNRIKDKRVLRLVKAFLKAGVLTELGTRRDTVAGTPQGGILSPLLANIALSVLDKHLQEPWKPGGMMSTGSRRNTRHVKGLPTWKSVRDPAAIHVVVGAWGASDEAGGEDRADVLGGAEQSGGGPGVVVRGLDVHGGLAADHVEPVGDAEQNAHPDHNQDTDTCGEGE
jgi:hypothetical protein